MSFTPSPIETDGQAKNPGPRLRRRGPRSQEAVERRYLRNLASDEQRAARVFQPESQHFFETSQGSQYRDIGFMEAVSPLGMEAIHIREIATFEEEMKDFF